ncbi:hypothetical protein NDU88_005788 [Pleurodeles waltl]|uniref:Uncharacterized protein n=1 Tax=Pleurodeles waltl TaxID=8319 RepID=A0AAV7VPJ3_PLEWA|nr:hypothetical protein NDU88_005788 [Pleurodeles waltl]
MPGLPPGLLSVSWGLESPWEQQSLFPWRGGHGSAIKRTVMPGPASWPPQHILGLRVPLGAAASFPLVRGTQQRYQACGDAWPCLLASSAYPGAWSPLGSSSVFSHGVGNPAVLSSMR